MSAFRRTSRTVLSLVELESRVCPTNIPMLLLPGITGSFPAGFNFNNPRDPNNITLMLSWAQTRATSPTGLMLATPGYQPFVNQMQASVYKDNPDLVQQVPYDWRLQIAPEDHVIDGRIRGITASDIAKTATDSFTTCLDYLGYSLRTAAESWLADNPGEPLQEVDVVAHSMGNLVTRAYIQSDAYGGYFTSTSGEIIPLPKIRNFVQMAPPNLGSPTTFPVWMGDDKPMVVPPGENYASAITFPESGDTSNTLLYIINLVYNDVSTGGEIPGPTPITKDSITVDGEPSPVELVRQYVPSLGALIPTYAFVKQPDGKIIGVQDDPKYAVPSILYDMNNGPGTVDLPHLVNRYDVVYGTEIKTVDMSIAETSTGADNSWYPLTSTRFPGGPNRDLVVPVPSGQTYYNQTAKDKNGDGTVPLISLTDLVDHSYVRQIPLDLPYITHGTVMTTPSVINLVGNLLQDYPDPELPPGVVRGAKPLAATSVGPEAKVYDAAGNLRQILTPFGDYQGAISSAVGDLTGDGIADFIFGAGSGAQPRVVVHDGRSLEQVSSFWAFDPAFLGGVTLSVADLNGDGVGEILAGAGAGGPPQVVAFHADGTPTGLSFYAFDPAFLGGVNVAGGWLDDSATPPPTGFESLLNIPTANDQIAPFDAYKNQIVVTPLSGAAAHVVIYSANGTLMQSYLADGGTGNTGASVTTGDFDGDGLAEVAVALGAGATPQVSIYSYQNPVTPIAKFLAYDSRYLGGVNVAGVTANGYQPAYLATGTGEGAPPHVNRFRLSPSGQAQLVDGFFAFDSGDDNGVTVG